MKKVLAALAAASFLGCYSVESATVSANELTAEGGPPVAVVQANAIGFTALFHMVDIVQSDLDVVVNRLLVSEAKAMGASKLELIQANTTPRHGIFAVINPFGIPPFPNLLGWTYSSATGIAVK